MVDRRYQRLAIKNSGGLWTLLARDSQQWRTLVHEVIANPQQQ